MIRVKAGPESLEKIVEIIPKSLKHTYNLGYLDVQLRRCGKLQALTWLLNRLEKKKENNAGFSSLELPAFVFMGDDDNDVEVYSNLFYI